MKPLSIACAAIAMLVAGAAQAQAPTSSLASTPAAQSVEVTARAARSLARAEVERLRGSYDLSDGGHLLIAQRGQRLVAELDHGPAVDLVARSASQLASVDGKLLISFAPEGAAPVREVTVQRQRR